MKRSKLQAEQAYNIIEATNNIIELGGNEPIHRPRNSSLGHRTRLNKTAVARPSWP